MFAPLPLPVVLLEGMALPDALPNVPARYVGMYSPLTIEPAPGLLSEIFGAVVEALNGDGVP